MAAGCEIERTILMATHGSELAMRDVLAEDMEILLRRLPRDRQLYEMNECERLLAEAGIDAGDLRRDNPQTFACDLFQDNPAVSHLVEGALQTAKEWDPSHHPADHPRRHSSDLCPSGMVAGLLPSDHHME